MGIDRMVMFLTDNYSIREVLAFPFMKEEKKENKEKLAAEEVGVEPLPVEEVGKSPESASVSSGSLPSKLTP